MIFKFLIAIGVILSLAACEKDGSGSERTSGTTQVDKTSDKIYEDLMTKAESGIIADASNSSKVRVGDDNPYRTNTHNYRYKAMAMCLDWNVEAAQVKRKWFQVRTGNDWGDVGFGAVSACENNSCSVILTVNVSLSIATIQMSCRYRRIFERPMRARCRPVN